MTSTGKFVSDLNLAIKAGQPITVVRTHDPFETLELIHAAIPNIRATTDKVLYWSQSTKWIDISRRDRPIASQIAVPEVCNFPKEYASTVLRPIFGAPEFVGRKPIFIVSLLTAKFKKDVLEVIQELRDFDLFIRNNINENYRLIILQNKSYEHNSDYDNLYNCIDHEPPTEIEIDLLYKRYLSDYVGVSVKSIYVGDYANLLTRLDDIKSQVVKLLLGLHSKQIQTSLKKATIHSVSRTTDNKLVDLDINKFIQYLGKDKFKEINSCKALTMLEPFDIANVGGMDVLREWLRERAFAYTPEARAKRVTKPKGALLVGPPGTGKSLVARAVGHLLDRPTVRFNLSALFNHLVGSSEGATRDALATLNAIGPSVVFIDEIDKVFNEGTNDSGVSNRVLGEILTWSQERTNDCFVIMTANRIQNIPPELLRKGRLDENFYIGLPNVENREAIAKIHLGLSHYECDVTSLAEITEGFSPAEIEYVVHEAILKAAFRNEDLTQDHLLEIASGVRPQSVTHAHDIQKMSEWAISNAINASVK